METKVCTRCKSALPLEKFSKNRKASSGYAVWCKPCMAEYQKAYRAKTADQQRAQQAEYRAANRDKIRASKRAAYHANIEENRNRNRAYYVENADRKRSQQRDRSAARKARVIAEYGGKCACCGEVTLAFLTMDHIANNGAEHRREIGGSRSIYWWLIKHEFPDGFQVLCWNCNAAKHLVGICPHQGTPPESYIPFRGVRIHE